MNRHGINPIVVINGIVITRAEVAEDLAELVGVDHTNIRMANSKEIEQYLKQQDKDDTESLAKC